MPALVPVGYLTILQAAETLLPSLYAGRPDSSNVISLRQTGLDVADGPAKDEAVAQLWKAVDDGAVTPMVVAGRQRRVIKVDPHLTKIPILRHPRGRGFTYLRPSHPEFSALAAHFGKDLSNVTVVFPEGEIKALARKLLRSRRARSRSQGRRGRPSRQDFIESTVRQMIEHGRVSLLDGLKSLTRFVNREGRFNPPVSDETVDRVLERIYEETKDRRFQRIRRKRRGPDHIEGIYTSIKRAT